MTKKNKNSMLLIIGIVILVFFLMKQGIFFGGFLGALIPIQNYNGDMEAWCINTYSGATQDYGYKDPGTGLTTTKCTNFESVPLVSFYDGLHNMNEIPLYWTLHYGCCTKRTTDAHSGSYAVLLHKDQEDDWEGFGITGDVKQTLLPAVSGKTYNATFWYKEFFLVPATTRGGSFSLYFFDSNKNEVVGSRQTFDFNQIATYVQASLVATAPAGTAYVGFDIWLPVESHLDLYIDDLSIDEADPCTLGTTRACGTDTGVCVMGTQICGADAQWGPCTGGVKPIVEACNNTVDDDCDGQTDENCNFIPYSRAQLITNFDIIDSAFHSGQGTSDTNSPTYWAWDNTPIVEGYLNMYMATGNTAYLDKVIVNTDLIISKATIDPVDLSTTLRGASSGYLGWWDLEKPIDPILTYSRITFPMIKFAYVVRNAGLSQYYPKADQYVQFVETNFIPRYDVQWRECGTIGFWLEGAVASSPNNRASHVGRLHLYLWLIKGDQKYYDRSVKYANKFKSTLLERNDGPSGASYYFWNYANKAGCKTVGSTYQCDPNLACPSEGRNDCVTNPAAWTCSGPLEMSYGNYDMMLLLDYYEAGIAFTSSDLQKFINTFKEGTLVTTTEVSDSPNGQYIETPTTRWKVEPDQASSNEGYYSETSGMHHWARLGHYDAVITDVAQRITRFVHEDALLEGTFFNHVYTCVRDTRSATAQYCVTSSTPGWDDNFRATPAYSMSRMAHLVLSEEKLSPLGQPPVCTPSWSCSAWTNCASDGTQARTCTDSNNCGTLSGKPVESQSCTPTCTPGWSCTAWSVCDSSGQQIRACADSNNCGITEGQPTQVQSCTPICTPSWSCLDWTACINNLQYRTCSDSNTCGITTNQPATQQSCVPQCIPNWSCTYWSICASDGTQFRSCSDYNNCGTTQGQPTELQSCTPTCNPDWQCGTWSSCNNNIETRTCADSNSCGITGGKPAESQSCTPLCIPNWSCTYWSTCDPSGQQVRSCSDSSNCGTTQGQPTELQSCTPTCTPNWQCADWSSWSSGTCGTRTRSCTDSNNCGVTSGKPTETDNLGCSTCGNNQIDGTEVCDYLSFSGKDCISFGFNGGNLACLPNCGGFDLHGCYTTPPISGGGGSACYSDWRCDEWTGCGNGTQARKCVDNNNCTTATNPPLKSITCVEPTSREKKDYTIYIIIAAVILGLLVLSKKGKMRGKKR